MRRGEVWWVDLGDPRGSEPGYRRPVVIVSANRLNESGLSTTTIVVVSSNLRLESSIGNFRIPAGEIGLRKPSIVVGSALASVDKAFFLERIARLPDQRIAQLNDGLIITLGLK
jgi:mRNA interferase MazF